MIVRRLVKRTNFPQKGNLFETLSQWIRVKRRTGRVQVGGHDFPIPQQLFRSFPLTESVTKIKANISPTTQTSKARGGLIPGGWGWGGGVGF